MLDLREEWAYNNANKNLRCVCPSVIRLRSCYRPADEGKGSTPKRRGFCKALVAGLAEKICPTVARSVRSAVLLKKEKFFLRYDAQPFRKRMAAFLCAYGSYRKKI